MSTVLPLRGLRPGKGWAEKVASVPYDVVNTAEARALAKGNPESFLHIIRPEIDLSGGVAPLDNQIYNRGKTVLEEFQKKGVLVKDPVPCFYLYAQKMGEHRQIGLVGLCSVNEYDTNVIKKHEKTRPEKEEDRTRHIVALRAHTGPVFLTYAHQNTIDQKIQEETAKPPEVHLTASDGIEHTLWVVQDPNTVVDFTRAFQNIPSLYIADGHHRSASASGAQKRLREANGHTGAAAPYDHFLSVLFPDNQLKVLAYNRAVKDLAGLSSEEFLGRVQDSFQLAPNGKSTPDKPGQVCMFLNNKWSTLSPKEQTGSGQLDVDVLQKKLLAPVLNIEDPRTSNRISFVGGIRGTGELEKMVQSGDFSVAFSLFPVSVGQLMAVADAGDIMPPKSTWFEPKLRSGLVVHAF